MENILITGGAGYIGSHIAEQLINKKMNIIILDNLSTGRRYLINKKAEFIKGDIKNIYLLKKIILNKEITSIIHMAACLNINESENKPIKYFKNNVLGTINLLKACTNTNVKNFIFSSSCSVYGSIKGKVKENKELKPVSNYAVTKYEGEKKIEEYKKKSDINFGILRYFNVAGASPSGKIGEIEASHGHLIKNLSISCLKKIVKINIYGNDYKTTDGTCIRDYMHVSDLASLHVKYLESIKSKNKSITLNCGYGKGFSVLDIVNQLKKITKKKIKITFTKRRKGDVAEVYADTSKLQKNLKWKPKFNNIRRILLDSIKWEKKIKRLKIY